MINFNDINNRALPYIENVLDALGIEHQKVGKQLQYKNPSRDDANFGSASINLETGLHKDFATDEKGGDLISFISKVRDVSLTEAAKWLDDKLHEFEKTPSCTITLNKTKSRKLNTFEVLKPDLNTKPPHETLEYLKSAKHCYVYHDVDGVPICYVYRFNKANGQKTFTPYTLQKDENAKTVWQPKGLPTPRPLYNLHLLHQQPSASVLIVEGEKSADAACQLFPGFVVVTTINGANSPDKSDLSPLVGRAVYIWPDNDEPGEGYFNKLAELLFKNDKNAKVYRFKTPTFKAGKDGNDSPTLVEGFEAPVGWDAADALAEGWTVEHIKLLPEDIFVEHSATQYYTVENATGAEYGGVEMPDDIVRFLVKFYPHGLRFINGSFYGYNAGYWPYLDNVAIITKQIAQYFGTSADKKIIDNHMVLLKAFMAQLDSNIAPNLSLICLSNGTLDTNTGLLVDHNPTYNLRTKTEITWDSEASCPRWLKFLDEIFVNDLDKAEKIAFLKAWFGYCLVPDNSQQKFLWMVGGGGNGKSLILSILTRLVGPENVHNAHIDRLKEKVVRAELEGKLINISSEMSADATISDGYLKSIVAGDIVEAERKFKPSFSFKPYVKLIAATNNLPRLLDLSDGFFRRAIVLSFNRKFVGADCDPTLEATLVTELSGIFKWAVEGLRELRVAGQFVIPTSSAAALAQYKAEADNVGMFTTECLVKVDTGGLKPSAIYTGYREWCYKSGFSPMNVIRFGRRLGELGFSKRKSGGKEYWLVNAVEGNEFVSNYTMVYSENIVPIKSSKEQCEDGKKFKL